VLIDMKIICLATHTAAWLKSPQIHRHRVERGPFIMSLEFNSAFSCNDAVSSGFMLCYDVWPTDACKGSPFYVFRRPQKLDEGFVRGTGRGIKTQRGPARGPQ
jgi:hypothetical protein